MQENGTNVLLEAERPTAARYWRPRAENNDMFREANVGRDAVDVPAGEEDFVECLQAAGRVPYR